MSSTSRSTPGSTPARIDKVIQIVASSDQSWEAAARNAVGEATKSIRDLGYAKVIERDVLVSKGELVYRIKLELAFQVDRTRSDSRGLPVQVRRYLIVANETLANDELTAWVAEKAATHRAEFHVVVPQTAPSVLHADPATGLIGPAAHTMVVESRQASLEEGERRLASFRSALGDIAQTVTGEVVLSDPVTATRVVMGRSSFDEILVSVLPAGISRWLKLDLPSRIERAFNLPVTTLVQHD